MTLDPIVQRTIIEVAQGGRHERVRIEMNADKMWEAIGRDLREMAERVRRLEQFALIARGYLGMKDIEAAAKAFKKADRELRRALKKAGIGVKERKGGG